MADETATADPTNPARILVVEDDENLRRLIAAYLETEGYQISEAADGESAIALADSEQPHLVVLDLMLPKITGLEVAQAIRDKRSTPILILTAQGSEADMLQGFEAGADDYLVKPFSPKVLVARVQAILRRSGLGQVGQGDVSLHGGRLSISSKTHEVRVDNRAVELTATEFDLLRVLAEHPGWVYGREELLEAVWGYEYLGDSRLVDAHIANLRKKIEDDPSNPQFVHTIRGVGYKFLPTDSERTSPTGGMT